MNIFNQPFNGTSLTIYIVVLIITIFILYKSFDLTKDIFRAIFNFCKSLVLWIKPSFESEVGLASSRRLSAFAVMGMYMYSRIHFISKITDAYWLLMGSATDAIVVLLLFGIVTAQQVLAFKSNMDYIQKNDLCVKVPDINNDGNEIK